MNRLKHWWLGRKLKKTMPEIEDRIQNFLIEPNSEGWRAHLTEPAYQAYLAAGGDPNRVSMVNLRPQTQYEIDYLDSFMHAMGSQWNFHQYQYQRSFSSLEVAFAHASTLVNIVSFLPLEEDVPGEQTFSASLYPETPYLYWDRNHNYIVEKMARESTLAQLDHAFCTTFFTHLEETAEIKTDCFRLNEDEFVWIKEVLTWLNEYCDTVQRWYQPDRVILVPFQFRYFSDYWVDEFHQPLFPNLQGIRIQQCDINDIFILSGASIKIRLKEILREIYKEGEFPKSRVDFILQHDTPSFREKVRVRLHLSEKDLIQQKQDVVKLHNDHGDRALVDQYKVKKGEFEILL